MSILTYSYVNVCTVIKSKKSKRKEVFVYLQKERNINVVINVRAVSTVKGETRLLIPRAKILSANKVQESIFQRVSQYRVAKIGEGLYDSRSPSHPPQKKRPPRPAYGEAFMKVEKFQMGGGTIVHRIRGFSGGR